MILEFHDGSIEVTPIANTGGAHYEAHWRVLSDSTEKSELLHHIGPSRARLSKITFVAKNSANCAAFCRAMRE